MFYLLRNSKLEKSLSAIWLQTFVFFNLHCIYKVPGQNPDKLVHVEEYGKDEDKQINSLGA